MRSLTGSHGYPIDPRSTALSDVEKWDTMVRFSADLRTYNIYSYRLIAAIKFGTLTLLGDRYVTMGPVTPPSQGGEALALPNI